MACILFADEEDVARKINIDDLYEKNQRRDLKQLSIFNKILNRIHRRINTTSRNKRIDKFIWFTIPEYIFGEPVYDKAECIAYVVAKLEDNGFFIKFVYPNTLFVSWENWVPTYKRNEIKKKMGIIVDQHGNVVDKVNKDADSEENINAGMFNDRTATSVTAKETKQYKPIHQYKPTGNLVYGSDFFEKIEKKVGGI
jgi:hypothetical protein